MKIEHASVDVWYDSTQYSAWLESIVTISTGSSLQKIQSQCFQVWRDCARYKCWCGSLLTTCLVYRKARTQRSSPQRFCMNAFLSNILRKDARIYFHSTQVTLFTLYASTCTFTRTQTNSFISSAYSMRADTHTRRTKLRKSFRRLFTSFASRRHSNQASIRIIWRWSRLEKGRVWTWWSTSAAESCRLSYIGVYVFAVYVCGVSVCRHGSMCLCIRQCLWVHQLCFCL